MTAKKKAPSIPADRSELYEKLVKTNRKVEIKGAANSYTALNGNMFSLLKPNAQLALRLPDKEREEFLKKYKTRLYEAYGAVMKEYVSVPDSLFNKTKELERYFDMSYQYAKTLKPKPTTKKR